MGKRDFQGFLSSLLIQLCTRSHHGYAILLELFVAKAEGSEQPSEGDLIKYLKKVLKLLSHGTVYIIVDALDETSNTGMPSPRENVLGLIKELVDPRHLQGNIRLCITSRYEVNIRKDLEPLAFHSLSFHDKADQREDINNYIKRVVETDEVMRAWRQDVKQRVFEFLSKNANGM